MAPSRPVFDEEQLRESCGDDADFARELLSLYLETTHPLLDEMEAALRQGDAATLVRAAHALKGGSRNVGAAGMGDLAARIEALGRAADLGAAASAIAEARGEIQALAALFAERYGVVAA